MISEWICATGRTGSARLLEVLLAPASGLYLLGSQLNRLSFKWMIRRTETLPAPVVSVGNLAVGGTGKTPFAAFLACGLKQRGLRPVLLSRGYGRQGKQKILSASDGEGFIGDPASVGDEPAILAQKTGVPVMVSADRAAAGRAAWKRFSPDIFLLDDGFQHYRLARNLDIVLLDARRNVLRERLLPRGPLREPIRALRRAGMIVLTRWTDCPESRANYEVLTQEMGKSVFRTVHEPVSIKSSSGGPPISRLRNLRVFAFSGLAGNRQFVESLRTLGVTLVGFKGFGDHHAYTRRDREQLTSMASRAGADCMVTTEKDLIKLNRLVNREFDPVALCIELKFVDDEADFWNSWSHIWKRTS